MSTERPLGHLGDSNPVTVANRGMALFTFSRCCNLRELFNLQRTCSLVEEFHSSPLDAIPIPHCKRFSRVLAEEKKKGNLLWHMPVLFTAA